VAYLAYASTCSSGDTGICLTARVSMGWTMPYLDHSKQ